MSPTPYIEGLSNLRELGRGGFGVVYQAHQPAFGRDVAVKVIPGGVDADAIARFERECRATGSVSGHPNIVRVHDAGVTADGDPYLVMDLLGGGTLAARVRRDGPVDAAAALSIGVGLAGALETAHRAGVIHRDVKPENVLFSDFGEPQLVDFGIARMQDAYETRTGTVSATLAHAAPEVIAGEPATARSDIYSLGSVLFFALRGEAAFARAGEASLAPMIARISSDPVPDLRPHGVPDAVAAVIERAMAKSPADRYESAEAMGEALRQAGVATDLPTGPVPIAATRVALPTTDTGAAETDDTGLTSARPREALVAATPPPPASALGRSRMLALAALAIAIVLALFAVIVTSGDEEGDDVVAGGPVTTTTVDATTTTVVEETTTVPEETTTIPEDVTRTVREPIVVTTVAPTTTRPPTTTTAAPTTTTTAVPIRVASAVVNPRSSDPVAVEEVNGVPQRVRITLQWQPPADNGGSGPTEYRIHCTLMQNSSPYTGPGEPAPCRGGAYIGSTPAGVTTFQPVVDRVEPGPSTWLRWEIVPMNEAGAGPATTVSVVVPNFVGRMTWEAYPYGRVVGLAVTGGQRSCGREPSTICEQSRSVGALLSSGSNVVLYEQPR